MCPKRFDFGYIQKIRSETTWQMQRGLDVHDFINRYYDNLIFTNGTFAVNPEFIEDFFKHCSPDAIDQINNFMLFEQSRWEICKSLCSKNPKKLFIPLLREEKFFSNSLEQVTILDRLDLRTDGNYTLVEIKTERFNPKGWKETEFRREMMFEKLTAESSPEFQKRFPKDIVDFVVYFPRGNDIFAEPFGWRTASALKKQVEKMREAIVKNDYPCNVAYACRFCYYNSLCSFTFDTELKQK